MSYFPHKADLDVINWDFQNIGGEWEAFIDWLTTSLKGNWQVGAICGNDWFIYFELEEDIILFKLRYA